MITIADAFALAGKYYWAGNVAGAEQTARSILGVDSNHAGAHTILGIVLDKQGRKTEAAECFRRAADILPHIAEAHYNLGKALANLGQNVEAAQCYRRALSLKPNHVNALNNLGILHKEQGDFSGAIACYRQALLMEPCCADTHNNLGDALNRHGQREEALRAFQDALQLEPGRSDFHYNLAVCFHEQGDLDAAVSHYLRALRLKPNAPDALNNLGKAYKEQGLLVEAIAQFREALRLQPFHAFAIYNLSELVATGHYRFPPAEFAAIRALTTSLDRSTAERSLLSYTVATVLHQQGAYDEAFEHFRQANELRRCQLAERKQAFDGQKHRALVERIVDLFTPAYFKGAHGGGLDTELPVFIVGMPRSGSTLVEQILASHPQVFGAGERCEIARLVTHSAAQAGAGIYTRAALPNQRAALDLATEYHRRLARLGQGAARVIDKTLDNFLHLGVIATLFPRARIIHCRRDPVDLCLSCYFQNFQDHPYTLSLDDIGTYYAGYEKIMAHWSQVLPLAIHEVRYEEMVRDQEAVTRRLLEFLGLPWDERCLTFFTSRRVVRTASTVQVRKPVSTQAIGRWKNYRSHLSPLFRALGLAKDASAQKDIPLRRAGGIPACANRPQKDSAPAPRQ